LPPEHRTPRVEALEAIVDSTPRDKLIDFPLLQPLDHQMIGTFIQLFNYMDFNLRRAIETFAHAKLLQTEAAKAYPKILIVIDELGYLPFSQSGGQLLFHLISKL
jgi:IstB-like ATP binding protein